MTKHSYGVVHGTAICRDCGWETESYKNAQALAAKHAEHYGHNVEGELGIAFSYTGTSESAAQRREGSK